MMCAFETSKPAFQGHLKATLPEDSVTIWGPGFQISEPMGAVLIQTTKCGNILGH